MAKSKRRFVCQECGQESPRWMGRCPGCGQWNSLVEETVAPVSQRKATSHGPAATPSLLSAVEEEATPRTQSGVGELDRVLGGGLVHGSLVLLGGDPGIGKSTLLLQAAQKMADHGKVLYISGEESTAQIAMRARRLGVNGERITVLPENRMEAIRECISQTDPQFLIVDSIQTVYTQELTSAPGTVGQVRECTLGFMEEAKGQGRTTILVGHVTKSGNLAGPKVLEHMVDTVLYLEGEHNQEFRILRAVKNRFGSTSEIGIFEMQEKGMTGISDASRLFISERSAGESGTVIFPGVEGSRVFLLEVQALAGPSPFGTPRRLATGIDLNRLLLMTAVVEKKMALPLGNMDLYLNVAGGMKVAEPAADLAVCLAVISSAREKPLDPGMMAIGEVGLVGEIRSVPQIEKRVREGASLGFRNILVPKHSLDRLEGISGVGLRGVSTLAEAVQMAFGLETVDFDGRI